MQATRNKRAKREPPDSQNEVGEIEGSADNSEVVTNNPWYLVEADILSDEYIMNSGAPKEWRKIALDNGWNPWGFRMNQSDDEQRLRTFNLGIEWFDLAWEKYAGIPKLVTRPGPSVRNVVIEWANQKRTNSGIKGSPIKMICLLHFMGELIDRSSPELMGTEVEHLFIPACEKATQAIKKRQAFFNSVSTEENEESPMYRVIFRAALQDAYPAVKVHTLIPESEKVARSEEKQEAFLVAMSSHEDYAMHRTFFDKAMDEYLGGASI